MMITVVVCLLIWETCGGTVAQRASPVWNSDVVLGIKSDESSAGTSSDEEYEEHDVESFVLCAFVHAACSPLLHGFLKEEESCTVAPSCHLSLDVLYPLSGVSGFRIIFGFESFGGTSFIVAAFLKNSPIPEGPQHNGEGL